MTPISNNKPERLIFFFSNIDQNIHRAPFDPFKLIVRRIEFPHIVAINNLFVSSKKFGHVFSISDFPDQ